MTNSFTTRSFGLFSSAMIVGLLLTPAPAGAQLGAEVDRGRAVAEQVRSGGQTCAGMSDKSFELMGEYAMSKAIGNGGSHAAMNRRMDLMMGREGEQRMHVALGHRYANCPGAPQYGWMGSVGEMMGSYSAASNSAAGPGMMGGNGLNTGSAGGADSRYMHDNSTDMSAMMIIGIALGAAILGGLLAAGAMRSRSASANAA